MNAVDLLVKARHQGLRLSAAGDHLRVSPRSRLTPELERQLRASKAELLPLLSAESDLSAWEVPAPDKREPDQVRIEQTEDHGRPVWRLVDAESGRPLYLGLFVSPRWARAYAAERGLHVLEDDPA